jgi:bla regulator protein BlaR1
MIPALLTSHLWQSTAFAAAAWLLTLTLGKNPARIRHGVWLVASVKFLLPFSLVVAAGSHLGLSPVHVAMVTEVVHETWPHVGLIAATPVLPESSMASGSLLSFLWLFSWFAGSATIFVLWCGRRMRMKAIVSAAVPLQEGREFEAIRRLENPKGLIALRSQTILEPGVFGIIRPVLLVPGGIAEHLTDAQLEAVLSHELCHVRHRDNLAAAVHMVVETVFWFHPLVWWLGARLVEARERACDEEVLRRCEPRVYAESLLKVCRFYLRLPLPCASGISGGGLSNRIERIMTPTASRRLDLTRRLLLCVTGIAAIAGPLTVGILSPAKSGAQQTSGAASGREFEVASVKPGMFAKVGGEGSRREIVEHAPGTLTMRNVSLASAVQWAYDLKEYQVLGPEWRFSERYDILAKATSPASVADMKGLLQKLLAERFQLTSHREKRQMSVYALTVGKNAPRLQESRGAADAGIRIEEGSFVFEHTSMPDLSDHLSALRALEGRPVLDKTGIVGTFDFRLKFGDNTTEMRRAMVEGDGSSVFTVLPEQTGLRLESRKGSIEVFIIDLADKFPSAN